MLQNIYCYKLNMMVPKYSKKWNLQNFTYVILLVPENMYILAPILRKPGQLWKALKRSLCVCL